MLLFQREIATSGTPAKERGSSQGVALRGSPLTNPALYFLQQLFRRVRTYRLERGRVSQGLFIGAPHPIFLLRRFR